MKKGIMIDIKTNINYKNIEENKKIPISKSVMLSVLRVKVEMMVCFCCKLETQIGLFCPRHSCLRW